MGRGSVGRAYHSKRGRMRLTLTAHAETAEAPWAGSKLPPPSAALRRAPTVTLSAPLTLRDAFTRAARDAGERGLAEIVCGALLAEAKAATGVGGVYGVGLYRPVGEVLGYELVKVGKEWRYRTRGRR
jgi:hypothetical protein